MLAPLNADKVCEFLNQVYPTKLELLTPYWRKVNKENNEPSIGFCYIGAEAAYHMLGGKTEGWTPHYAVYDENGHRCTHWWLKRGNEICDPTENQYLTFGEQPPYHLGKGSGFLTKEPSLRAQKLMVPTISKYLDYLEKMLDI